MAVVPLLCVEQACWDTHTPKMEEG